MDWPIPEDLHKRYRNTAERRAWLRAIPQIIERSCSRWQLHLDLREGEEPGSGYSGVVYPVTSKVHGSAALKITFPYEDNTHEAATLRLWDGQGAVKLFEFDAEDSALLLDRLDAGRELQVAPMPESIKVWGELVTKLSIPVDDRPEWKEIPRLATLAEQYSDELPQRWQDLNEPFPRWLLESALQVCQTRGAVGRRSANDVLMHADLHGMNILARPGSTGWDAENFLAIDPQGLVGEVEFALIPMLSNRLTDLDLEHPEEDLLRRFDQLCDSARFDHDAAREWAVLRTVEDALWYAEKSEEHVRHFQRCLWISSTLLGRTIPHLMHPHQLEIMLS